MPKPLVVVITGASAGLGRAIAHEFAKIHASIGLLARGEERLKETETEVKNLGGIAIGIPTDVSNEEKVEKAAQIVEDKFGPIDIWINNATTTVFSPIIDITSVDYKRVTEVTYLGTVYGTMSALKRMYPRNKGTILQVGSALSYRAIPLQSAYCGAKHAIRAFTDSLRSELIHDKKNIYLTMVQLPALNTPQFSWSKTNIPKHPQPVPPIFQPEVAARAIKWAAFNKRREVWVGGPTVRAIIMNHLFPSSVDEYLALTGYDSQFLEKEVDLNRPNNLFSSVKGDYKAHGIFDKSAKKKSIHFFFEKIPVVHYLVNIFVAFFMGLIALPELIIKRIIQK